jgi:cytidylate kinase
MAVITIARELASLGEEIAQELVKLTGYKLIDKEYLEKRLTEIGISPSKNEKFDEKNPGFWASLSQQRDDYLHFLKTAILEVADGNDCIIMGRGAYSILGGVPNVVSIKITAPMGVRVERIKKLHNCDDKHALQIIEQSDHDRGGFHKYFFSTNWLDPREYDITINSGSVGVEQAAALINALRNVCVVKTVEEAGARKVADLLLGQKIVTEIIYTKKIPVHFLEASVEKGIVILHGVANTQNSIDSAVAAAHEVPGVSQVDSAIQLVQEFTVMP